MDRKQLIETLEIVSKGLAKSGIVPILSDFCFTGKNVYAWNDNFAVVGPCQVDAPFACHGETLLKMLKELNGDEVDFSVEPDTVVFTSGDSTFNLPIFNQDEFVWKEPDASNWDCFDFEPDVVQKCLDTCSADVALKAFNNIAFGPIYYSTNSDALTRVESVADVESKTSFWVSRDVCLTSIKIIAEHGRGVIAYDDKWVVIDSDMYKVYGRNLGKPEIDYEGKIRELVGINSHKFSPIPAEFNQALSRARVLSDAETAATHLEVKKGVLTLLTNTQSGEICDTLATKHSATAVSISAALVQESLKGCDEMIITDTCMILKGPRILRLVANMS